MHKLLINLFSGMTTTSVYEGCECRLCKPAALVHKKLTDIRGSMAWYQDRGFYKAANMDNPRMSAYLVSARTRLLHVARTGVCVRAECRASDVRMWESVVDGKDPPLGAVHVTTKLENGNMHAWYSCFRDRVHCGSTLNAFQNQFPERCPMCMLYYNGNEIERFRVQYGIRAAGAETHPATFTSPSVYDVLGPYIAGKYFRKFQLQTTSIQHPIMNAVRNAVHTVGDDSRDWALTFCDGTCLYCNRDPIVDPRVHLYSTYDNSILALNAFPDADIAVAARRSFSCHWSPAVKFLEVIFCAAPQSPVDEFFREWGVGRHCPGWMPFYAQDIHAITDQGSSMVDVWSTLRMTWIVSTATAKRVSDDFHLLSFDAVAARRKLESMQREHRPG